MRGVLTYSPPIRYSTRPTPNSWHTCLRCLLQATIVTIYRPSDSGTQTGGNCRYASWERVRYVAAIPAHGGIWGVCWRENTACIVFGHLAIILVLNAPRRLTDCSRTTWRLPKSRIPAARRCNYLSWEYLYGLFASLAEIWRNEE